MSFALLFSGQGTLHPEMLPWLADDAILRAMCTRLGTPGWRSAVVEAKWTERNANAQSQLVADLLDISRAITGRIRISPSQRETSHYEKRSGAHNG